MISRSNDSQSKNLCKQHFPSTENRQHANDTHPIKTRNRQHVLPINAIYCPEVVQQNPDDREFVQAGIHEGTEAQSTGYPGNGSQRDEHGGGGQNAQFRVEKAMPTAINIRVQHQPTSQVCSLVPTPANVQQLQLCRISVDSCLDSTHNFTASHHTAACSDTTSCVD